MFINYLLDFLFPPRCIGCNNNDYLLCENCREKLVFSPYKTDYINNLDCTYISCKSSPLLKTIIHRFKYSYKEELGNILGDLLSNTLKVHNISENYILVPIPLHISRKFWRGFNQAELLAKMISKKRSIPVKNLLKRNKKTHSQAKLKRIDRINNLKNAFFLRSSFSKIDLINKKIILVDDIATTGATFESAAQALRNEGFKEIYGLAICRGL